MGSFLFSLQLICSTIFICLGLYKIFIRFHTRKATVLNLENRNLRLPPGRKGWPFVGEILHYLYHIHNGVAENFVENRRKEYSSKVFKTSFAGESVAILCGAEGNKFLFSNEKKLVQVWWPQIIDQLFPKSGNKTTTHESIRVRRMISGFFKPDSIRKGVGVMDSVIKCHLQSDRKISEEVEISSMSKKYTSELSCRLILSISELKLIDEFSRLVEVISIGLHTMPVNLPGTALSRGIKASKVMRKEIEKMVKQRKIDIAEQGLSSKPQDMITHLLLNTDENGQFLNEFDIASNILSIIEASYANLHSTITLVMVYLSDLPQVYNNVLREQMEIAESKDPNYSLSWEDLSRMKYTWNVACEVLRLLPPIGSFREAITDFEYGGYLIPKGWKMHWIARATQKNPEYFQDPEKFDPSRFEGNGPAPFTFVPFGGGPRMCPAMEYSRLALLVFIHNVVTKFKWEKIIPDEKLVHGAVSHPAYGLPVYLHPLES